MWYMSVLVCRPVIAQVCNWILYYKRDLWGVPLEELMARKGEVTEKGTREGQTPEELGQKMVY